MHRFAIHSNRVVTPSGTISAFVTVDNGLITAVLPSLPSTETYPLTDVGDKVLMPGVIDPHVHINEPGRTHWEGFDTATRAAAFGGVTTLAEMPLNASPVTTTVAAFEQKLNAAAGKLHTHCGFWGGVVPGNQQQIRGLIERGILGFKAFLTHSGIDDFPNVTEQDLRKVMPLIASSGLPLLVHCEMTEELHTPPGSSTSYYDYLLSRPKRWENNAIALMIRLCREYQCRTHIVHLSSAESIAPIRAAKAEGLPLTVETAQHYLYFQAAQIEAGKTAFKCAPPIREKENNDLLWEALKDGVIDLVATDHSPAPPEMKQVASGDFMQAWGGISSIQFALPVLLTLAKQKGATLGQLVKWLCEKPAELIGKQSSKGKIAAGFDADLVVVDTERKFRVTEDSIQHRHKLTPYLFEELYGVVEKTYIKGINVYEDGALIQSNQGEIILR